MEEIKMERVIIIYDKRKGMDHKSSKRYEDDSVCVGDFVGFCNDNGIKTYGDSDQEIIETITLMEIAFEYFGENGEFKFLPLISLKTHQ